MKIPSTFHLSLKVIDLKETKSFYVEKLGGVVTHEDDAGWINIELFGHQLTFHESKDLEVKGGDFHWGFNLDLEEFNRLKKQLNAEPILKGEGTAMERLKFYFQDPNGYLVEIKHFVKNNSS